MIDTLHSISATASVDPVLTVYDFHAIEAINAFYAENGWEADYRQIEPGPLRVRLQALMLGNAELFRERLNRRVESSVTSAKHACSLISALSDVPFRVSGRLVGRDDLLLVPPNTRLTIVAPAEVDALTIHLPIASFGEFHAVFGDIDSLVDITHMTLHSTPTMNVDAFREMVLGIFTDPGKANVSGELPWTLLLALTDMLVDLHPTAGDHDPYGRFGKYRTLVRARSFVHGHLAEEIRMKDLYEYVGVSLSTLERVFRRELGMSPRDYVLASRLHEVRRRIWGTEGESSVTIADIAMNCGFTHMGRFSSQYERHFGRLPSRDRHRGSRLNGEDDLS